MRHRGLCVDAPDTQRSTTRLLDILLALFAALAVALRPLLPGHGGDANLWVEMCIFVAAMAWLVRMAMTRRLRLVRTGVALPAMALLLVATISTARSPHKAASVTTLLEWLSYAVLFFVLVHATAGSLDRRFFLRLLWASAFAVCLYGLFQQFVNLPLLREQILSDPERVKLELGLRDEDYLHLAERARGRIFATFLLANSFAGFLALVFPGFVGYVLDRLRAGDRRKPFVVVAALWVAAALLCLLFTYSKGGWVSFAVGTGLFCVLLGKGLVRRHWRLAVGLAAGAALAVGALFAARVVRVQVFRDAVGSMDVRLGYWRGGWAMAKAHLATGVGLGTFGSHYPRYRWPQARATQQAHNDYLQVLAELGIVGLAAFVWLWASLLRRAAAPRAGPGGSEFPPRIGYVAGILAFALGNTMVAFTVAGWGTESWWPVPKDVCDLALVAALAVGWVACFAALGRGERTPPGELCRKGLLCGLVAFLVHCAVDFDYHEPGVVLTAWVVAALAVARRGEVVERRLRPVWAVALGAAALLAMVGFQVHLTRSMRAESEREMARSRMVEAHEAYQAHDAERWARLLAESRRHYERALAARPLDDGLRLDYGAMLAGLLMPSFENPALLERTVGLFARAGELNRASPTAHTRLAELVERAADAGARAALLPLVRRYEATHPHPARNPAYLPAVAEYEEALARDPHTPKLHFALARALEKLGDLDAAERHVRRALDLHDLVTRKHSEHVYRLKAGELAEARKLSQRLRARSAQP